MRRRLVPLLLAGSLTTVGVAVGAPAQAATTDPVLLPPVPVSAADVSITRDPVVAVDDAGNATVAWLESSGASSAVAVATRGAGAAGYSAPQAFACGGLCEGFSLDVDAAGDAVLAWAFRGDGNIRVVRAATRTAGAAAFGAPSDLRTGPGDQSPPPTAVMSSSGTATVVWYDVYAGALLQAASSTAGSGAWSAASPVPGSEDAGSVPPEVVSVSSGVAIGWRASATTIEVSSGAGATTLSAAEAVTVTSFLQTPELAANASGTLAVAWATLLADGTYQLAVATRKPGETFSAPRDLSPTEPVHELDDVAVAVASDDMVTVAAVVESAPERVERLYTASIPAGGGAPARQEVPTGGPATLDAPTLVVAHNGARTLAWEAYPEGTTYANVRHAHAPAGAPFAAAADVTSPEESTEEWGTALDVDGAGDVTFAWVDSAVGGDEQASSRVLDVAAPVITAATAPATATAGTPAAFSATATDRWSNPTTLNWDFGDGQTGTGTSPLHSYTTQGSYQVTVTATDAVGHATTVTRSITVSQAPASPRDTVAPVLSDAKLTPKRLPTGRGARLRVTSSEAAKVVGLVQRKHHGAWRRVGTKRWSVREGANIRVFYGKTAQQRLVTGKHRVLLTATDAAGNASTVVTLRFRVDRG